MIRKSIAGLEGWHPVFIRVYTLSPFLLVFSTFLGLREPDIFGTPIFPPQPGTQLGPGMFIQ
jgi:hypothetical protein